MSFSLREKGTLPSVEAVMQNERASRRKTDAARCTHVEESKVVKLTETEQKGGYWGREGVFTQPEGTAVVLGE